MQYVNLGYSGLKVSKIGFGKIVNPTPEAYEENKRMIQKCLEVGVNHFDTAEMYEAGKCEIALGQVLKDLQVERSSIIVATKILHGAADPEVNSTMTLNYKHLKEGLKASIKRLQLEYVDLVYAHDYDANTPMEEICRGFNSLIEEGLTFYWGVSNWSAECVFNAFTICEKLNFHKPICVQLEYNMLVRNEIELEYDKLFKEYKLGLISWGSVAGGFLSGKHLNGISEEEGNKLKIEYYKNLYYKPFSSEKTIKAVNEVKKIVETELNCSLVVASLAWCLKYEYLSAALIGARKLEQLEETLTALNVVSKLTPEIEAKINRILDTNPETPYNFVQMKSVPPKRPL